MVMVGIDSDHRCGEWQRDDNSTMYILNHLMLQYEKATSPKSGQMEYISCQVLFLINYTTKRV